MTKPDLYHFISKHKLGVLGYLSTQREPRSALVGIAVTPELEIVFDTMIFTFMPGVPQHVEKEDQAGVIAAIEATGATASITNVEI